MRTTTKKILSFIFLQLFFLLCCSMIRAQQPKQESIRDKSRGSQVPEDIFSRKVDVDKEICTGKWNSVEDHSVDPEAWQIREVTNGTDFTDFEPWQIGKVRSGADDEDLKGWQIREVPSGGDGDNFDLWRIRHVNVDADWIYPN